MKNPMKTKAYTGVVGSKSELFPPKEVREVLGIRSGGRVLYIIKDKVLLVRVIPSFMEALQQPKFAETTIEEFEREMEETQTERFLRSAHVSRKNRLSHQK